MASSSYESTPETTNTNRVCRVILGPCTDGLRDILRHHIPPPIFPHVIKQNKLNLPRLTADQRDMILPRHGSYTGTYNDMDISLLYILLRNITGITPHSNGWSNDPDPIDSSLSANIERVRLIRNKCYGHSIGASMSNKDFVSIWSDIRSVMVDVDAFLNNGNTYQKALDFLRYESMDPELDEHYENELRQQVEEDRKTRKMVVNLKRKCEETEEETRNLHGKVAKLTNSPIPLNVREIYDIDIRKWREEDKLYCETHSFPLVMEKVINQPYITFVGVSGSGKSATAHHIALKLQEKGYEVVPTKDIRKIEDYCDPGNPQVFVIDDVVGVFGLQKTKLDVLTDYEEKITKPCMLESKTLMTCRETVFNETLPYTPFLTKNETVIKLHSSDHALDHNDKKQILQKYGLNKNLMSPALLKSTSRMFPLLCKLYSKETKFQTLGCTFFQNPVQCIIDEFDDMQKHNKLNYATLVLCMLNEGNISKDILKDRKNKNFMNMKIDTLENCRLEQCTDTFKFMDALSAMEGSYTKQSGTQYAFIHESMFEICGNHYGKQFPDQMLLYMSSSYIANYVKAQESEPGIAQKVNEKESDFQSNKGDQSSNDSDRKEKIDEKINEREESYDLCIRLREDQYPLLAERLHRDIQNMELYDVFSNQILKHPQVCQAFIDVIEKRSYTELKSLFLSSHGKVDKIMSKRECVVVEIEEKRKFGELREWERQNALVSMSHKHIQRHPLFHERTYNVRVISWVIYYGHYQIIKYILQRTEQHNEISELFEITRKYPHQYQFGIQPCNKQEVESNTRLAEKWRLLLLSCYSGDVHTVRALLPVCKETINGSGEIIRGIAWGYTPLIAACDGGHVSILKELLKAGADVNLQSSDIMGHTPLIVGCKRGHMSVMAELLKAGADVNLQTRWGDTPLIAACEGGNVSVVEELVKAGANVNSRGLDTPLLAACGIGNVSVVQELVKAGADVNQQNNCFRDTAMIKACKGGYVRVVEELVKAKADVNLQNKDKNTPLIVACERGCVSVVEELVKAKADVNLQNKDKNTPLIVACERGCVSVVEELVKAKADVNLQNKDKNTPLIAACKKGCVSVVKELVKVGADVNLQDSKGDTPLLAACKGEHVNLMEELVKAGANVNIQNILGETPLIVVCWQRHVSVVEDLVKTGADVNLQTNEGRTPLIGACERGHVSVVKELVKARAKVNLQDCNGRTPLIAACGGGHMSVVEELVKAGANVNIQDKWGNTPLMAACEGGHMSVVVELVKAGVNVNLQDNNGSTPLIAACEGGNMSVVVELVKAGANVNLQDNNRSTPLIAACEEGHVTVVEELLKARADVNVQNIEGNTPLIAACEGGHATIVEELVKARANVNVQNIKGNTPLIAAVKVCTLSTIKFLVKHGAQWVTQIVDLKVSVVYIALILNKIDIVKFLIQEENKNMPGKFTGNEHLFNCLVDVRHAGVKTDSRDDVVVTGRSVWCMDEEGDLWKTIMCGDCGVLRHLLCVGLDVNHLIQLNDESDARPLLHTLLEELLYAEEGWSVDNTTEKVRILLGAGLEVQFMVRNGEIEPQLYGITWCEDFELDREGVSFLEWTRRAVFHYGVKEHFFLFFKYILPEYMDVFCEIKKRVRRHYV